MTPDGALRRAKGLAERGRFRVEPNPPVGCVLVKRGRVVGEGWHGRWGGPHAEVMALRRAGAAARGATAYVTLEPCGHTGKTGPCADALIRGGVRAVVYAAADPNPGTAGVGPARLREAGAAQVLVEAEGLVRDPPGPAQPPPRLDRALAEAGIERCRAYVTNAVKHFKFVPRGKRRMHKKPADAEIDACHQWLERELELVVALLDVGLLARRPSRLAVGAAAHEDRGRRALHVATDRGGDLVLRQRGPLELAHAALEGVELAHHLGVVVGLSVVRCDRRCVGGGRGIVGVAKKLGERRAEVIERHALLVVVGG